MKNETEDFSAEKQKFQVSQDFISGVTGIVLGVVWTVGALVIGAPWVFGLFGIFFVAVVAYNTYMEYKNTAGTVKSETEKENSFCPYCGAEIEADSEHCKVCGEQLSY